MIVHYHDERSGKRGEAQWPDIVGMVNSGGLSPGVLVHVNGSWITFAAANAPAKPPKPSAASEMRELDELLHLRREWDVVDRLEGRLRGDSASLLREELPLETRAKMIMASRRGEDMEAALFRLRPDLDPANEPAANEVVKRSDLRGAVLRRLCRLFDWLSDSLAKLIP